MTAVRESSAAAVSPFVLYLAFAGTGVACALPGATLPAILAHWLLCDSGAGLLFLLTSAGSSCGALLCRGRATHSLAYGAGLLSLASAALVLAGRTAGSSMGHVQALGCFLVYGLGLGITMTSVSLIRSERGCAQRGLEMNRLNLVWAIGAFTCPFLAAHALRVSSITMLVGGLAIAFACLAVWALLVEIRLLPSAFRTAGAERNLPHVLPPVLMLITALATGVESAAGGWLATYASRLHHSVAGTVTVASAFWGGLLLSRAVSSTKLVHGIRELFRLRFGAALAACAAVLLFAGHSEAVIATAAFLLGLGIGPVFPLLLAFVLPRFSGSRVFFFAGFGGALLPWITGYVSGWRGSLRDGLLAPLMGSVVLALAAAWLGHGFGVREAKE